MEAMKDGRGSRPAILDALRHHPRESLLIVGITVAGTIAYYPWTTSLPTYANSYAGVSKSDALTVGTIALALFGGTAPTPGRR